MKSNPDPTTRLPRCLLAAGVLLALAGAAAGDEDGRKLLTLLPPVPGPMVVGEAAARLAGGAPEAPFQSENITLLSWIPLNEFPGGPHSSSADCWGYTSPGGHEYALMGLQKGTAFVRITDPENPQVVGYIAGPSSLWKDVTVIGHHAYAVSEGGQGIHVIDMSNIDGDVVTLVQKKQQGGHTSSHTILSNPASGYLYLCGTNVNNGGLTAVSTANPADPIFEGSWKTRYVHEAVIESYTSGPYAGKEIAFLYTGGAWSGSQFALSIVDVTTKSNFITLASVNYPNAQYSHQGWLTPDKKYMYLDDELDGPNQGVPSPLTRIFDITNLSQPQLVGSFTTPGNTAVDHNLYVNGKFIYESNYTSGLRVFNGADPLNPVEIAYIDTHPESNNPTYNGNWGNYPFHKSGSVVISDMQRGLFVVRITAGNLAFAFPGGVPNKLQQGAATPITVEITEEIATLDAESVTLHVGVNGGSFAPIAMSPAGGGAFSGEIPGAQCNDTVSFYISAMTTFGNTYTTPAGAPGQVFEAVVDCQQCYADCDGSGTLDIDDFLCFQLQFALSDPYADCDNSGTLNIDDFICFQLAFALGC